MGEPAREQGACRAGARAGHTQGRLRGAGAVDQGAARRLGRRRGLDPVLAVVVRVQLRDPLRRRRLRALGPPLHEEAAHRELRRGERGDGALGDLDEAGHLAGVGDGCPRRHDAPAHVLRQAEGGQAVRHALGLLVEGGGRVRLGQREPHHLELLHARGDHVRGVVHGPAGERAGARRGVARVVHRGLAARGARGAVHQDRGAPALVGEVDHREGHLAARGAPPSLGLQGLAVRGRADHRRARLVRGGLQLREGEDPRLPLALEELQGDVPLDGLRGRPRARRRAPREGRHGRVRRRRSAALWPAAIAPVRLQLAGAGQEEAAVLAEEGAHGRHHLVI